MNCCKCSEPSVHSIIIREIYIKLPGEGASKADNIKDKTRNRVIGFCEEHWGVLMKYIAIPQSTIPVENKTEAEFAKE